MELSDYSDQDLIKELKDNGFDFIEEVRDHEMIEYLESIGCVINNPNAVPEDEKFVDYNDLIKLKEIRDKFLNSSWEIREKIYKQIVNDEPKSLHAFNNVDMFYHLDDQGFDFLDNIDSQEMISHIENVGYKVIIG